MVDFLTARFYKLLCHLADKTYFHYPRLFFESQYKLLLKLFRIISIVYHIFEDMATVKRYLENNLEKVIFATFKAFI